MKYALDVWMEEKEEEWKKKANLKTAKALKAEGMDVETIARVTGLTVDDVLRLD